MKRMFLTLAPAAALAACGGPQSEGGKKGAADGAAAAATDWNAADACALLDKAAVGAALGGTVTETSLAFVHQASGAEAATSECTYRLAGGGDMTFMARRSPIADNTPAVIAQTRKATESALGAFSDKAIEDVPGLGKAAFFVPGINQLNVFLDDERFVVLTVGQASGNRAKDVAIDLAKKAAR